MKFFILLILLSSTAFAGSFTKTDQGNATWSLSVKKKVGNIVLTRYSSGTEGRDLTIEEQMKVMISIGWPSLGTISNGPATFENSDERSQETVSELIKKKMLDEMSKLNIQVKDVEISLENISCQEKGFFKKQLNCNAQYKSRIEADFNN